MSDLTLMADTSVCIYVNHTILCAGTKTGKKHGCRNVFRVFFNF